MHWRRSQRFWQRFRIIYPPILPRIRRCSMRACNWRCWRAACEGAFLPIGADRVTLDGTPHRSVHLRASITSRSGAAFAADIFAETEDGRFVAAIEGVRFVKADASRFSAGAAPEDLYAIEWAPAAGAPSALPETAWIVLED